MKTTLVSLLLVFVMMASLKAQTKDSIIYKTVYSQGFASKKSIEDFEFSDGDKWLISQDGESGKALKCIDKGSYINPYGGPSVIALLKDKVFTDFVLEMDIMQNGKDFNSLDLCFFFGVVSDSSYCYAQIADKADKQKHAIFSLNSQKITRISKRLESGVIWGYNKWHHIKIERLTALNTVKVYYDDVLLYETTEDPALPGRIGFGSTISALKVDNIKISAPQVQDVTTPIF